MKNRLKNILLITSITISGITFANNDSSCGYIINQQKQEMTVTYTLIDQNLISGGHQVIKTESIIAKPHEKTKLPLLDAAYSASISNVSINGKPYSMNPDVCVIRKNTGVELTYYGADEDDVLFCEPNKFASTPTNP